MATLSIDQQVKVTASAADWLLLAEFITGTRSRFNADEREALNRLAGHAAVTALAMIAGDK